MKRLCVLVLLIVFLVSDSCMCVNADKDNKQETTTTEATISETTYGTDSIAGYALSWNKNPNIKYQMGGKGRNYTLEECDKMKLPIDCSGFVMLVYKHFGIKLTGQSEVMKSEAVKTFKDEKDAVPGDVCWWQGHVALYVGNGTIIHTNTCQPPNNIIHITKFSDYRKPTLYCRMVKDVSKLGQLSKSASKEASNNALGDKNETTYSDITGFEIKDFLGKEQQEIVLKTKEDLPQKEQENVVDIKEAIHNGKVSTYTWYGRMLSFLGIVLMCYGVLLFLACIFDRVNSFIDVSLVSILSFNKWTVVFKEDIKNGVVKEGYNEDKKKSYLSIGNFILRVVILMCVSMFLLKGKVGDCIAFLLSKFIN